jgi:4-hydroxy-tetrahydrodipicolinate synthase
MANRISEQTTGVCIIAATPFLENGELDLVSVDSLVEFYIEKGVSGITILGMMGEAQKLTAEESEILMKRFISRVDNRIPVIVGVSNAGLGNLAKLSKQCMASGASGVMVAPVSGLSDETKVYNYYSQVFDVLGDDIPVVYQDYPQTTNVNISVGGFSRLVKDFDQLVMLKHEDCPGLGKLSQVRSSAEEQSLRRVSILVGNGGLYLPQELARGADGAMTGFAWPEMLVNVVSLFQQGKSDQAEDLFDVYLPLVKHEQQPGFGLALRKEVLKRRGAITNAITRAPGPKLNTADQDELSHLIQRLENKLSDIDLGGI